MMKNATEFACKLMRERFTLDFYRIELLQNSYKYEELVKFLKLHELDYVEDIEAGGAIVIFRVLRDEDDVTRQEIFAKFGDNDYFAMEGNMTLASSALYRTYRQIQEKQESL